MLSYEQFKKILVDKIKCYLPEECKNYKVEINVISKVNMNLECVHIAPEFDVCAIPTLYIKDWYNYYVKNMDVVDTMRSMAEFYLEGMKAGKGIIEKIEKCKNSSNIVMNFVNTKENMHLRNNCPHRDFLDLTIIYRLIMELPDGSFNSAIIVDSMAEDMNLSEEELYDVALENTKRIFPPLVEEITRDFNIMTNERFINGAISIIYNDQLKSLADKLDSDLYILPSSVHEVIILPIAGRTVESLLAMVNEANHEVLKPEEILSYSVYYYSRESNKILIATQ